MFVISCAFIGVFLFIFGSSGNGLCILVFLRKRFRHRIITPYFIVLLFVDSIYLLFRLIKLFYYSQTLFKRDVHSKQSCSNTLIVRAYQQATQTWPQTLVPLVHSETYMRFSIILMCIMSVQRTTFLTRSLKSCILPATYTNVFKHKWSFLFIILAFLTAYLFEFTGLTLFCSKSNNRDISYEWFIYINKYMKNSTYLLTSTISNQSDAFKCVNHTSTILQERQQQNQSSILYNNTICTKEQLINILSHYFDQHQKSIVNLIQKILYNQTGQRIARNEIRRKYHFHECLFPQEPNFFHRHYSFMYSQMFGFNRHTLLLICGSVLPSLITIISNILSVCRVRQLNRSTSVYILPCRRRTDDTRRVLLVITVECLFAIINSWFSDILLSLVYCKRRFLADDECPMFLRQNYDLLVMFDMFNSISNIILHCLCGKHFRNELRRMLKSLCQVIKSLLSKICCCYLEIQFPSPDEEQTASYDVSVTRNDSSNNVNSDYLYLKIQPSTRSLKRNCCDCRWYVRRQPLIASRQCLSRISKEYLSKNRTPFSVHYHSLSQRAHVQNQSMRLYFPQQQAESLEENKKGFLCFR